MRKVVLARELTKKFEEYRGGLPGKLLEEIRVKRSIKGNLWF